jgi:hypothetical protein
MPILGYMFFTNLIDIRLNGEEPSENTHFLYYYTAVACVKELWLGYEEPNVRMGQKLN